ncbi:Ig-like domain-containing protein [Methanobacterium sp.]|jgi:predicted outer membrane repeat protein|uniref:Ig-like domain-containing protein n=1 Tax=Methanobacterium sp. TaxID=2164 RepID=UPI0031588062
MKILNRNKIPLVLLLINLFVIVVTISCVSADSTVYVNATVGSDFNPGTSDLPYLTIDKGVSSVDENGTVQIADGIYSGEENTNLTISKNMTIIGQSQGKTIINGTGTNWIFNVSNDVNFTIQNLTIINGTAYNGGAIDNQGTLNAENCTFDSNNAVNYGGAIYNTGTINLTDCIFTGNAAYEGSAIYNDHGSSALSSCIITGNTADAAGAVYSYRSSTNITSSTFNNNTATYGGAIYNTEGSCTLQFNRIVGNTADYGNDIYCGSGSKLNAEYNWWGSNDDPSVKVIGAKVSKWLVLTVNSISTLIKGNEVSNIIADLLHDNTGIYQDPASGHIPDGINIVFDTTLGTIDNSVSIVNGAAQSTLKAGSTSGVATVSAAADSQISYTLVNVDATSPTVTTIDPSNNTKTNIIPQVITVTFSEPIQAGSAYDGISVTGPSGTFPITKNIIGSTLTLTLDSSCIDGNYSVNIPINAVKDLAGNSLTSVFTSTFNLDTMAPTANASVKTGSYNVTKTITLNMSEYGTIYYTTNGTTPTTASKIYTAPLIIKSTTTLKFMAIDKAGNKSPVYTEKYTIDKTAPKVTLTTPKNGAAGVSRTSTITIKFSENIKSSVNWSKIYIKNMNTGQIVFIGKSISGNTLSIKMTYKRYPSKWYQVYIPAKAVKDSAGNNLAAGYIFKFKTGIY